MVTIQFSTENEAFADRETECARILRWVADRLERGETAGRIIDANGNIVGTFEVE